MSSDEVKLQCLFCPHKQTVRLRAGSWWTCKKCGKRNPGPSAVRDVLKPMIEAGHFVIGRRRRRNVVPGAGAKPVADKAAMTSAAAAPTAGTTVGRRKVRRTREPITATSRKVAPPKPATPHPQPPAKPAESSSSVGGRLLGLLKEAIV